MRAIILPILTVFALAGMLLAQAPRTVVVSAATPAAQSSNLTAVPDTSGAIQEALRMLQEMKAANEETLRKQAATLEQLDELEKAADQLKIYTKRG